MAQPGATPSDRSKRSPNPSGSADSRPSAGTLDDHGLVTMFNEIRDELVSTLLYMLGNADDAQDAAQEAFLKCWRARQSLQEIQNLRAWIFRVGLNAAKDFQRSAWNRRSRPLPEDDLMMPARDEPTGQALEDREALERLRGAIALLRPEEKEVFLLRQNGDLTYE